MLCARFVRVRAICSALPNDCDGTPQIIRPEVIVVSIDLVPQNDVTTCRQTFLDRGYSMHKQLASSLIFMRPADR